MSDNAKIALLVVLLIVVGIFVSVPFVRQAAANREAYEAQIRADQERGHQQTEREYEAGRKKAQDERDIMKYAEELGRQQRLREQGQ